MDILEIKKYLEPVVRETGLLEYLDLIVSRTTPILLRAGEQFPKLSLESHRSGYIASGVLRVYAVGKNGKESTIRLPVAGDFVIYLQNSSLQNIGDPLYWTAVTNTEIMAWSDEDLAFFVKNIPNWHFLTIKIMKQMVLSISVERAEMFNDDATTRYQKFAQRYPQALENVPLRHIANYLGIAPQSLSRIRHNVAIQIKN
jgi:CRP-like cAMP-binding protein